MAHVRRCFWETEDMKCVPLASADLPEMEFGEMILPAIQALPGALPAGFPALPLPSAPSAPTQYSPYGTVDAPSSGEFWSPVRPAAVSPTPVAPTPVAPVPVMPQFPQPQY